MPADAIIETHVDAALKQKAEAIFAEAGTTIDQVLREVLERSVANHSIPYGLFAPNAEAVAAMEAARRGEFAGQGSINHLFAEPPILHPTKAPSPATV